MHARLHRPSLALLSLIAALVMAAGTVLPAQVARPTQVLFICPHGAAKSVLASTYFQELAAERGLRVVVDFAGTDPDQAIAPAVANHLKRTGHAVPATAPRQVTSTDVQAADVVISLGCDLARVPGTTRKDVRQWDVPGPGEHLAEADAAIRARVIELVDELVKQQRQ